MTKTATIIICILTILSCKLQPSKPKVSLRDSAINHYLTDIRAVAEHDTLNEDFLMLRAYQQNDTAYLRDYFNRRNQALVYLNQEEYKTYAVYPDSCIHIEKLNKTVYEEAYRFTYSQSFCSYKVIITMAKRKDSAQLQFVLFKPAGDARWDTAGCRVIRNFTKALNVRQWEQIQKAIKYADFWSLKRDSESLGVDGSTIEVEGYLNEQLKVPHPPRYHVVRRWLGSRPAIFDALTLALKLSGNKVGCLIVN